MPDHAELIVSIDPKSLEPVMLLYWELTELRDRLRTEGLTEHADTIDGMLGRLDERSKGTTTEFVEADDG